MTDDEFLCRLELADLGDLRHRGHVRAALAYIDRDGPAEALPSMVGALRHFTAVKGKPEKFHYTLTRAWLELIADARRLHPTSVAHADLIDACPLLGDAKSIDLFYSKGLIASDGARGGWVEPDRAPLRVPTDAAAPIPSPDASDRDAIVQFLAATSRARAQNVDTTPMVLATADARGFPSARMVLLRGVDARGFVFHTNYTSRKARELTGNPHAALCLHWPTLEEQIRVEGSVARLPSDESDAYFAGRPRGSQIGAWSSDQSQVLPSRAVLEERIRGIEQRFEGQAVPRPPFWGGFRLSPNRVEFWYGRTDRLHERLVYVRDGDGWRTERLFP